ncbi:MAG: hypothetical protein KGZ25_04485, partial [Planctomycetes bacterium]|nr:hypothetical protein [Planctomycetota bacterium]
MKRKFAPVFVAILSTALALLVPCVSALGAGDMEQQVLRDLRDINPTRHLERLSSLPSRFTGYAGCSEAEKYVHDRYESLGLANIRREPFQIIIPVDEGAGKIRVQSLEGEEVEAPVYCFRPNSVRSPKTPESGIRGQLIWGGQGYLRNFNQKDVMGSIVLMEFNTASRWLNAAKLGAKAIVFVEPRHAFRNDAEQKYSSIPIPIPRYYIQREHLPKIAGALLKQENSELGSAEALKELARLGEPGAENGLKARARVFADMVWEEKTVYMVSGEIPGTDPELARQTLVCHSYYDSTSVVPALSPGAESACGIASQIEIARFLTKHPPRRTVKFLATPGHFQALAGVRQYAFEEVYSHRKGIAKTEEEARAGEPHFFIGLDISSRHNSMAGFYKGHFYDQNGEDNEIKLQRLYSDYSDLLLDWAGKIAGPGRLAPNLVFQSGIVPQHGRHWRALLPGLVAFDAEVLSLCGRPSITLATTGDPRNAVNTPADTFENISPFLNNVKDQAQASAFIIKKTADIASIPLNDTLKLGRVGSIFGRAIEQTLTAYVPTVNVPDAVIGVPLSDNRSMLGVSGQTYARSDVQGLFEVFGAKTTANIPVEGFKVSPSEGSIQAIAKRGLVKPSARVRDEWELRKTDLRLNFYECASTTIFDLVEPLRFQMIGGASALRAEADSEVRSEKLVVYTGKPAQSSSYTQPIAVVFTNLDRKKKFKFLLSGKGVLLNVPVPLDKKQSVARGRGLSSVLGSGLGEGEGGTGESRYTSKENEEITPEDLFEGQGFKADQPENYIHYSALQSALDMHLLDYFRLYNLEQTAISKKNLKDLHAESQKHLNEALKAKEKGLYDKAYRHTRLAQSLELRVYPDVKDTAHDVVRGVVFYFALLLPFVIFIERLLINYVDIRKKLVAIAGLFAISYLVLRLVHPAFRLSKTPIIILDGFFMLVASIWTITYLIMKFQTVMEHIRQHIDTIHRADVARASAAMAAFILGISNMRKRKIRTMLTALTLILLTFTILSFTSFETMPDRLLQHDTGEEAPYTGLLLRQLSWTPFSEFGAYDAMNHFLTEGYIVSPRSWFTSRKKTEELKLEITRVEKDSGGGAQKRAEVAVASAMVGMAPQERLFSGVDKYVRYGRWFPGFEERTEDIDWPFVCLLPSGIRENLRIEPGEIEKGTVKVSVLGRQLRVIGIVGTREKVDGKTFFQQEDLDEEPLTPVDFVESSFRQMGGGGKGGVGPSFSATGEMEAQEFISRSQKQDEESMYVHMDPDRVLFVPHELCLKLGGTIRSIAMGPVADEEKIIIRDFSPAIKQFASRTNMPLYVGIDGRIQRLATRPSLSMGGLQGLIVPIMIAALIVFNTMLGAVYERVTEIKVYAA